MATTAELLRRTFRLTPTDPVTQRWQHDAERDAAAEKRLEAAESRRESERRWYARLPIMAIGTLCVAVSGLTGLLVAASLYTEPLVKKATAVTDTPPKKEAVPPPAPASAPKPVSIKMNLSSRELFGFNSSALRVVSGSAQRALDACLEPNLSKVHVIGHADCIGSDEYNLRLSERRALAVKRYLTEKGVEAALITTEGLGAAIAKAKAEPLCTGGVRATAAKVAQLEPFRRVDVACEYAKQVMQV